MNDDRLHTELTDLLTTNDPVPHEVREAAKAIRPDPTPVHLREHNAAEGHRAAEDVVLLRAFGVTVRLELGEAFTGVVSGTSGRLEVRTPHGSHFADIGPDGRFTVPDVPRGPVSPRVHGEALLVGEWFTW